jgi:hypothetical protein
MAAASDQDVVRTFVKLATQADLSDEEIEALRNEAAKRSGISRRTIAIYQLNRNLVLAFSPFSVP